MVDGGDVEPQRPEAIELRGEIALVDLEREVMERRSLEPDRLPRILGERDGQGLVEQPDDLSVAAVPVGDLEKCDAVELLEDVEPDDVHV